MKEIKLYLSVYLGVPAYVFFPNVTAGICHHGRNVDGINLN